MKLNTHVGLARGVPSRAICRTKMRGWRRRRWGSFTVKPIPYINVVLSFISFYFQIKIPHSTYGECDAISWWMVVSWRWRTVRVCRHSQMLVRISLFKFLIQLHIHNEWINFLMTLLSCQRGGWGWGMGGWRMSDIYIWTYRKKDGNPYSRTSPWRAAGGVRSLRTLSFGVCR